MNNAMTFLAGHTIDFLTQPREAILGEIAARLREFEFENPGFFRTYEQETYKSVPYLIRGDTGKWEYADVSLNGQYGDTMTVFLLLGPYGLLLRISNPCVQFLYPSFTNTQWYSPQNRDTVTLWRNCFKRIATLLGGAGLLYITEAYFSKYHGFFMDPGQPFEQKLYALTEKHGATKKTFEDFGNGKYPRYFIDK